MWLNWPALLAQSNLLWMSVARPPSDQSVHVMFDIADRTAAIGRSDPAGERLAEHESWALLRAAGFGRLAVAVAGEIDVFPINFVVDGGDVVFRTAQGTKLLESVMSDLVAVEADHRDHETAVAWSVVAKGPAELVENFDGIYIAEKLGIKPWVEAPKECFVRVRVNRISGRRFYGNRVR